LIEPDEPVGQGGSLASEKDSLEGNLNYLEQLGSLGLGDVVEIWEGGSLVVKTVIVCQETVDGKSYGWRWYFLDDGSLLEASPDGNFLYKSHRVVNQGTDLYEELVAQDGALVRFEARVREGSSGRRPVEVTIDGKTYRITGTGTVRVQQQGPEPEPVPWRSFDRDPDSNVYFGLVDVEDDSSVKLGLWTVHVCLSSGRELGDTDVTAVYRKS
jgi:hypothetical protein